MLSRLSTISIYLSISALFIFSGCNKILQPATKDLLLTMDDLVVSPDFNWQTTREINLWFGVNLFNNETGLLSRINIYDGNPSENGNLLTSGSAGYQLPFITLLRLPATLKKIFAEIHSVTGYTEVVTLEVKDYIQYTFIQAGGLKNPYSILADADGDGVPDNLDDYPADPTRVYNLYYPNRTSFGSIIFEDLWPSKGDYDLNDLVVDYQFKVITNARNDVVDLKLKFYIRAVGAGLQNGFGFQLDKVLPEDVSSVTGYSVNDGYISLSGNGLEADQSKAVVIVFDNTENVIHRPAGSGFFNTESSSPHGISDSLFIALHFSTPQLQSVLGTPPYNPFLIKGKERGAEIHMADYLPTSLVNPAYFGAVDDNSDPATGRTYKTINNLPWVMTLPVKYDYTYERIPVIGGHLHFADWAQSVGSHFPDWYLNNSTYRNDSTMYH